MMKELYKDLETEYENYKKEAEEKFTILNTQIEEMDSLKNHIEELENTNAKLKEELAEQVEQNLNKEEESAEFPGWVEISKEENDKRKSIKI